MTDAFFYEFYDGSRSTLFVPDKKLLVCSYYREFDVVFDYVVEQPLDSLDDLDTSITVNDFSKLDELNKKDELSALPPRPPSTRSYGSSGADVYEFDANYMFSESLENISSSLRLNDFNSARKAAIYMFNKAYNELVIDSI